MIWDIFDIPTKILAFIYFAISFLTVFIIPVFIIDGLGYIIICLPIVIAVSSVICGVILGLTDKYEGIWIMPFIPVLCAWYIPVHGIFVHGAHGAGTAFVSALFMGAVIYIIAFMPMLLGSFLGGRIKAK